VEFLHRDRRLVIFADSRIPGRFVGAALRLNAKGGVEVFTLKIWPGVSDCTAIVST
jgi:hypothetical protein